jgi:DNA-binding NarL/FixJ family response regulator
LRVLVIAEDPLVRGSLVAAISASASVRVIGDTAPSAYVAADVDADLLLVDLGMAREPSKELLRIVSSDIPVLVLFDSDNAGALALNAGARGVLARSTTEARLYAALMATAQGLTVVENTIVRLLKQNTLNVVDVETLTSREREVLSLLAEGRSNKQIAATLGISENTAKFHVNAIFSKLDVETRTEAVVRAARLGLVFL